MKSDFEETLSYLAEKLIETWNCIDELRDRLSEKEKLLEVIRSRIEEWKPKKTPYPI